jgi:hypothetical protein
MEKKSGTEKREEGREKRTKEREIESSAALIDIIKFLELEGEGGIVQLCSAPPTGFKESRGQTARLPFSMKGGLYEYMPPLRG